MPIHYFYLKHVKTLPFVIHKPIFWLRIKVNLLVYWQIRFIHKKQRSKNLKKDAAFATTTFSIEAETKFTSGWDTVAGSTPAAPSRNHWPQVATPSKKLVWDKCGFHDEKMLLGVI